MIAELLLAVLFAQDRTTALPGPDATGEVPPIVQPCRPSQGDEVTVCANADRSRYRIVRLEPRFAEKPVRAEFAIPGLGTASAEAVQRGVGGVSVPSAMVSLRIPLGGRKKRVADK